jgi:prepilin-type N-terminal cleavage/methylation domain-containing protein
MSFPRRLRGEEQGFSLIEMLTVMIIMSVVLTGLTTLFVQGSNAELDLNRRFEAQQDSRVALDKIRREIHCAQGAATSPTSGEAPSITLDLPGQCPTAVGAAQTSVTWCSVLVSTGRYKLYRKVGVTCNATGVRWADYLTQANLFQYQAASSESLAKVRVSFPVDVKTGDATPPYRLCDHIVLRNTLRLGTPGTALAAC